MISENSKESNLPSWFKLNLKEIKTRYESSSVLMDHHLIIVAHDDSLEEPVHSEVTNESDPETEPAVLIAVDLRDSSMQEARVPEHLFFYHEGSSFTRYKDNQIIKFGGLKNGSMVDRMVRITVTSFEPFTVECERIEGNQEDCPRLHLHTAQIYQDRLFVYGGLNQPEKMGDATTDELWSFDLNNLTWELCKPKGEGPSYRRLANSFIYKDQLYVYGGDHGVYFSTGDEELDPIMKDVFVLDFDSMSWKRLEQQQEYLSKRTQGQETDLGGDIYKDNLLILGEEREISVNKLCSWNIKTNSWSTFKLDSEICFELKGNLIVYKNLLLAPIERADHFALAILNLDQIDYPVISESPEEKLFMNEAESDIALKVQNKVIPAHKQILMKRSRYFANLFNSGMAESRQDVIEINDCEENVFIEFLRFLYSTEDNYKLQDEDVTIKLFHLSDKYLQDDLKQKCIDFFQYTLTEENIYKRLDLAHKETLPTLEKWCITFLDNTVQFEKVFGLVEYLNKEENQEIAKSLLPLQKIARELVLDNYVTIIVDQEDKIKLYDEFLAKNVRINTFVKLAKFPYGDIVKELVRHNPNWKDYERAKKESIELLKQSTANLRSALFAFARENYEQLEEKKHIKKLPKEFLEEFNQGTEEPKKGVKRMEPENGVKPTLKKTKK